MAPEESNDQSQKQLPPPWDRIFSLGTRVFVWGLLFGVLYLLRPFFLLVFLTFVFAYILEHGVQGLRHRILNRPFRVVIVTAAFLGTLITAGVALAPSFQEQAGKIAREYPEYLTKIDTEIGKARDTYPWVKRLVPEDLRAIDVIEHLLGLVKDQETTGGAPTEGAPRSWTLGPEQQGPPAQPDQVSPVMAVNVRQERTRADIAEAIDLLQNVASPILGVGSAFLLSLLFSFLIVLDLPRLSRAVKGLANTKIGFIYDEVGDNIRDFGLMLGRALEAQLLIALCNTVLTAIGLWILGLTSNLVFLSMIVFFFSFIPVAGVIISSMPIALEALSQEGAPLLLAVVGMIFVIHMIEAYVLNPRIFGHHLHMNAVLVLIVLTIAGKLFGIWGLILGLPVVNYVFGHAIRRKKAPLPDLAGHTPETQPSSASRASA